MPQVLLHLARLGAGQPDDNGAILQRRRQLADAGESTRRPGVELDRLPLAGNLFGAPDEGTGPMVRRVQYCDQLIIR